MYFALIKNSDSSIYDISNLNFVRGELLAYFRFTKMFSNIRLLNKNIDLKEIIIAKIDSDSSAYILLFLMICI